MDETARTVVAGRLSRAVLLGVLVISGVSLFGFALPVLLADAPAYRSVPQQIIAFALLVVVLAAAVVRTRLRWVLLALVAVASVLAVTGVHDSYLVSESEWSYGVIGWFGVLLLLDRGAAATGVFLGAHVVFSFAYTAWQGQDVRALAVVTVLVLGYQVPVVAAAAVLGRLAAETERAVLDEEEARTAEAVAVRVHEDRRARYAAVLPLLSDLAARRADLTDELVRARYAVEAARMRRLFAEHDDVPDPLTHELRSCVEIAERRGVSVLFDTWGEHRTPPLAVRRSLVGAVTGVLATARSKAKVTVLGSPSEVTVSVVADGVGVSAAGDLGEAAVLGSPSEVTVVAGGAGVSVADDLGEVAGSVVAGGVGVSVADDLGEVAGSVVAGGVEVSAAGDLGEVIVTSMTEAERVWVEATWRVTT